MEVSWVLAAQEDWDSGYQHKNGLSFLKKGWVTGERGTLWSNGDADGCSSTE